MYFALTLLVETGMVQRLYHRAHCAAVKRWQTARRRPVGYRPLALSDRTSGSLSGSVAHQLDVEDEDVREERLMIESGPSRHSLALTGGAELSPHLWFVPARPVAIAFTRCPVQVSAVHVHS